jgi:ribosomal protein S7
VRPVRAGARQVQHFDVPRDLALVCVDQKIVNILLATPLGKKDHVAKTVQSDLSQMGARCELDMNNIVTASLEDLSPEEQKFKALQEYMQVQFLTSVKKDRSDKVARLKEFELSAIRLNDSNIEVIPTVNNKPPPETTTKSTVDSDELLASYIARLERLEDLEKDRALGFNNNDANSSTPKANP